MAMFPDDESLDFKFTMESEKTLVLEDIPFHILMLGDWSGRENRAYLGQTETIAQFLEIDRDNFEDVLAKLDVRLDLDLDEAGQNNLSLRFSQLDDFHPDKIFEQISIFSDLRDLRQCLSKSETFEKAADEVRSWFETENDEKFSQNPTQDSEKSFLTTADLLDNILAQPDQTIPSKSVQTIEKTGISLLISKVVKPFLIKTDEKEQSKLIAAVDEATSALMRKILHHPHFKVLESAWRGLYFLVKGAETNSQLKIFLYDITKSELSSNLKSSVNSENFNVYEILENDKNWALICGNYGFQINVDDIAFLIRLAKISNTVTAPFISYLKPETIDNQAITEVSEFKKLIILNDSPEAKLWNTIRTMPESESVGLLTQRLLIRLPYGADTEPTEKFSFEEIFDVGTFGDYLWINPCFVCALLLAQSFSLNYWEMGQDFRQDIVGLPTLVFESDGMHNIFPNSEFVLTESICDKLLQSGLMPIISFRNRDELRLARFQSIAFPNKQLKGKWN